MRPAVFWRPAARFASATRCTHAGGEALEAVEAVEPYCQDAQPERQIGLLALDAQTDRAEFGDTGGSLEGAAKLLLELHQQFDVITEKTGEIVRYNLLVIPDYGVASPALAARLRDFLNKGGSLLVSHQALLNETGNRFALADEIGVDYRGSADSNPDYFRLTNPALYTPVSRAGFDYSLYLGPCTRVNPRLGTEVWAEVYPSYFDRTWEHYSSHDFTPPTADKADYPAIARHGSVIYLYGPLFAAYERYGNLTFRALIDRCLAALLPQPLLTTDAPATAEVTVMRQPGRQLVHIANYYAMRRVPGHVEALEMPVPLRDVALHLRRNEPTTRVYLARSGETLPFEHESGVISVTVPRVDIHEIVVFSEK